MNGITELAKLFKERENQNDYSPVFGTIIELPNTKIRINDKIILTEEYLKACTKYKQQDSDGAYVNLMKEAVLLPYCAGQKFILIGVIQDVSQQQQPWSFG